MAVSNINVLARPQDAVGRGASAKDEQDQSQQSESELDVPAVDFLREFKKLSFHGPPFLKYWKSMYNILQPGRLQKRLQNEVRTLKFPPGCDGSQYLLAGQPTVQGLRLIGRNHIQLRVQRGAAGLVLPDDGQAVAQVGMKLHGQAVDVFPARVDL
jgi:hypothetical protein